MKYLRFKRDGRTHCGVLEDGVVTRIDGGFFDDFTLTEDRHAFGALPLDCPTAPSKVVCVGLNYMDHIREFGAEMPACPVIFLKPPTACLPHGGDIVLPAGCQRTDLEAELAVVIGKTCRNVSEEEAERVILGYSCINDVTARDFQQADGQWIRAKGFDTFCPYGPVVTPLDDPAGRPVKSYLNGRLTQNGNTDDMIFSPAALVSFVSGVMTLLPGDVISTGTPMGIAPMAPGDRVEIEIEGVGRLENGVRRGEE